MSRLTRKTYKELIHQNIEWLLQQPRSLERDHIKIILDNAVEYEYGKEDPTEWDFLKDKGIIG